MDKIQKYYSIDPFKYKFLKSFSFEREILEGISEGYEAEIIIQADTYEKLKICFYQVKNIKLKHLESLVGLQLEIFDIKNRQLEDINYKVIDSENEVVSFYCKSFKIEDGLE